MSGSGYRLLRWHRDRPRAALWAWRMTAAIQLARVSKCFTIEPERPRSFQELVLGFLQGRRRRSELLWALQDVNLSVEPGETLGLIGANGSGKSTCLKLMTRILDPTSGEVAVGGRVSSLLELGTGFHPELTGRDNIYLHGSVLGLPRREIRRRLDDIVAFAELERFVDVPVKFYSSGMYVRLAFSAAIHVSPDVLLVDEVLAVGDQHFQHKCIDRISEIQRRGVTIVFVSHDLATVERLCDRVVWLHEGRIREEGPPAIVLDQYLQCVDVEAYGERLARRAAEHPPEALDSGQVQAAPDGEVDAFEDAVETDGDVAIDAPVEARIPASAPGCQPRRWGSGRARITAVAFLDAHARCECQPVSGEPMVICITYEAPSRVDDPVFGIALHTKEGIHVSGWNTLLAGDRIEKIEGRGTVHFDIPRLPLLPGGYRLSAAVHSADDREYYDYCSQWFPFEVSDGERLRGEGCVDLGGAWRHLPGQRVHDDGKDL